MFDLMEHPQHDDVPADARGAASAGADARRPADHRPAVAPGWELSCAGLAAGGATVLGLGVVMILIGFGATEGLAGFYPLQALVWSPLLLPIGLAAALAAGMVMRRVRVPLLHALVVGLLVCLATLAATFVLGGMPVSPQDRAANVAIAVAHGGIWAAGVGVAVGLSRWRSGTDG